MKQAELIEAVAGQIGESKATVHRVLEGFASVAAGALHASDEVPLPKLGKLKVVAHAARTGRNPQTGEAIQIPAKNAVKFSASLELKNLV